MRYLGISPFGHWSRTWGPCRPATPKDSIRSELRGLQRARGVPEQHDGRLVANTDCHETPQNTTIRLFLTLPPVGPCFRRNFFSCGYGRGQNQTGLPNHDPKLTPAWLGGAIARFNATPLPGFCHWAGEPTGRQAAESPSRPPCKGVTKMVTFSLIWKVFGHV